MQAMWSRFAPKGKRQAQIILHGQLSLQVVERTPFAAKAPCRQVIHLRRLRPTLPWRRNPQILLPSMLHPRPLQEGGECMQEPVMTPEQFAAEARFSAILAAVKTLRTQGMITPKEYRKLRRLFAEKYGPYIGAYSAATLDFSPR